MKNQNNMARLNINRKEEELMTNSSIPLQSASLEALSSEYRIDGLKSFYEKKSLNDIDTKKPSSRPNSITKELLPSSATNRNHGNASPLIPGHSVSRKYEFTND